MQAGPALSISVSTVELAVLTLVGEVTEKWWVYLSLPGQPPFKIKKYIDYTLHKESSFPKFPLSLHLILHALVSRAQLNKVY